MTATRRTPHLDPEPLDSAFAHILHAPGPDPERKSKLALYAWLVIIALHGVLNHVNLRFRLRFIERLLVTPRFHYWHHAVTPPDRNFAVHFPWLDRWFGTHYLPDDRWPEELGIEGHPVPGYATLAVSLMFLGGIQLLSIGILGEYIGRIFDEVKQRPLYLVGSEAGQGAIAAAAPQAVPAAAPMPRVRAA